MVGWEEKEVLVTGATGFIGQLLVKRLAEDGARVYAATSSDDEAGLAGHNLQPAIQELTFDVRDAQAVQDAVTEAAPDVVFHLAAVGVTNPSVSSSQALAVNAGGAVNLLEALRGGDVRRVVLAGTCYEYGAREAAEGLDPFNAYAASKVAAWAFGRMYWRAHNVPVVTARPFQVYGPGQPHQTLIPAAIKAALTGKDFPMTPGEQARDFVYVEDVVEGLLSAALAPGIEGQSLDLGTGAARPIRQVVERVWKLTAAKGEIRAGARPYRPGEVMHLEADAERTARLTGWRAQTPLEEGLLATIRSLQSQI